jgi:hypothetical protein
LVSPMVCSSGVLPDGWLLVVGSDIRRSREGRVSASILG